LFELALAGGGAGLFLDLIQGGHQDSHQQGDNGDDHEKLD
jgi:hypothetical protein